MHSTIYEFSKHPISESRRATIDSLPEWFFQTVADSATDTDEISRAVQIRCLEQHFGDLCIRDGDQLRFVHDSRHDISETAIPILWRRLGRWQRRLTIRSAALCLPRLSMRRSIASRKAMQTVSGSTSMTLTMQSCFLWMLGCGKQICPSCIS